MNKTVTNCQQKTLAQSPYSPFRSLFGRNLFEEFFGQYLSESSGTSLSQLMNVSLDVAETDQAFEVKVDLPGIDPDQVEIQIDNNTLTIRGQRDDMSDERDEEKQFHRVERYQGSFSRSIVLPNAVNEEDTVAEFKEGVLKIVIPKSEDAKPRKITINR